MGGDISVASEEGKGSYFEFYLMMSQGNGVKSVDLASSLSRQSIDSSESVSLQEDRIEWPNDTRVLVVDDNAVNQEVASQILTYFGLENDVAGDGVEALEAMKRTPYALLLLDCQMPKMNGYNAAKKIRSGAAGDHHSKIPILAMTAQSSTEEREKCLQAGMDDFITKPCKLKDMKKTLKLWLINKPKVQ